jgi:hypothetical protein
LGADLAEVVDCRVFAATVFEFLSESDKLGLPVRKAVEVDGCWSRSAAAFVLAALFKDKRGFFTFLGLLILGFSRFLFSLDRSSFSVAVKVGFLRFRSLIFDCCFFGDFSMDKMLESLKPGMRLTSAVLGNFE